MNLSDLTALSPSMGEGFSTFFEANGISPEGVEFKVMPSYVGENSQNVIPVMAKVEGKWAGLSLMEAASPSEYAALLDAIAA